MIGRRIVALATALALAAPAPALAQFGPGDPAIFSGTITGTYTLGGTPTITGLVSANGWAPQFGLRQDANQGSASGGASYATADTITLNDGCSTHAVLNVVQVSSGAPTGFSVNSPGSCAAVPSDPVAQLSTSGSGSGASFTLRPYWGPIAGDVPVAAFLSNGLNGSLFYPPSAAKGVLNPNLGPVCVTSSGGCGGNGNSGLGMGGGTGMTGGENQFSGYGSGAQVTTGSFIFAGGHNALAVEIDGLREAVLGIDAGKLLQHGTDIAALGTSAAKFLQTPTNVVAIGTTAAQGGNPTATVSGAVNNGSGLCRLTVNSTTGMATGDKAVITGIIGATACNGVFTNVTVVDATHLDLTGSAFAGSYTSGGAVSDFTVTQIAAIAAVGSGTLSGAAFRGPANHLANIAAVGTTSLTACTSCGEIAGIGNNFGTAITTGNQHVLAGSNAGNTLQTGAGDVCIGYHCDVTASNVNNAVIIGGNGAGGGAGARGGSQSTILGALAGNASLTGANVTTLGYNVAHTTLTTGTDVILIDSGNQTLDAPAAASSHFLNVAKVIAGDTAGATNPAVCAVGMQCVIGVLRAANFNVTTDQSITIRPLTSTDTGFISAATKYFVTDIYVANCSASLTTAKGAFYNAAGKTGGQIGLSTTAFTNCTSTTTAQRLTGLQNQDTTIWAQATWFLSLTTAQGTAATGDVYIIGELVN